MRRFKGSIKLSKTFREKLAELELQAEIQRQKLKPKHKEEIPKQEEKRKQSVVKIERNITIEI